MADQFTPTCVFRWKAPPPFEQPHFNLCLQQRFQARDGSFVWCVVPSVPHYSPDYEPAPDKPATP